MIDSTLRIAVVGTGANGASIGADMIRAGYDVTFIEQWPAHVEAMRKDGLTVHLPSEVQNTKVKVYHLCEVAELRTKFDIIFTSVKTYDTRWVAELVKPLMHETSVFVGLQNGMTIDTVSDVLGQERSVGAVLGIAANMFNPGVVVRQVPPSGTWFTVGTMTGERTARLEQVAAVLSTSGKCEISDDIRSSKWMKLIANIPEMLPSAILNLPLLSAVELPGIRMVMDAASREAYALARELNIEMRPIFGLTREQMPDSDQYALDLLDAVLKYYSLPDTRVAVLQDWDKGRRAELDGYNGYIVEQRKKLGGNAPVNQAILDIAVRIESLELNPSPENAGIMRDILTTRC
ncbi:ketopantoate reductase family protein [Pseudomonas pudica]|uniref:2-dehydropantoate 2-reductase n=1 Tax=Pseudomonas pudica TaxID=272772 RepID=A0ABS0FUH3_9PSED|nr:2-dehydropantoate 2-reductase N-terminal domain-containing protein [Pseudomonas pudica]MBF8644013.1 NAD(P)-binding domain-containing protein [Pseudomonas pudica]MBF8758620.1 NAD(P)-binding domain-containing protein [Pseudomonas pudica]